MQSQISANAENSEAKDPARFLRAAVEWAKRGFKVFPLKPNDKTPLHTGWKDEATCDLSEVMALWTCEDGQPANWNLGCQCDGLAVVDVDPRKGADAVWDAYRALDLPKGSLVVRTWSGGAHVYFTSDVPLKSNNTGALGFGIDAKCGAGAYVLAPGSEIDGKAYVAEFDRGLLPAPAVVVERLGRAPARDASASVPVVDMGDDKVASIATSLATRYLLNEAPLAVEKAGGDQTTYDVACRVRDFGVSEAEAVELMAEHWNDRCSPPWSVDGSNDSLQKKVENAYRFAQGRPGAAHPAADFADLDLASLVEDEPQVFEAVPVLQAPQLDDWCTHGDDRDVAAEGWLYHRIVADRGVLLITGPSQSGKTFLLASVAHSVASGAPFAGVEPDDRGAVLVVFGGSEGAGFKNRLLALDPTGALPISWPRRAVRLDSVNAIRSALLGVKAQASYLKARFGLPARLIVFETLSSLGLVADENDNVQCANAVSTMNRIAEELAAHQGLPGVVSAFTHHPPKNGTGSRGGGALLNNADYALEVFREGREAVRTLELTKARNAQQRALGSFTLVPCVIGKDERGRDVDTCTVSFGAVATGPGGGCAPLQGIAKDLFDVLLAVPDEMLHSLHWKPGRRFVEEGTWEVLYGATLLEKDKQDGKQPRTERAIHAAFVRARSALRKLGRYLDEETVEGVTLYAPVVIGRDAPVLLADASGVIFERADDRE